MWSSPGSTSTDIVSFDYELDIAPLDTFEPFQTIYESDNECESQQEEAEPDTKDPEPHEEIRTTVTYQGN